MTEQNESIMVLAELIENSFDKASFLASYLKGFPKSTQDEEFAAYVIATAKERLIDELHARYPNIHKQFLNFKYEVELDGGEIVVVENGKIIDVLF
jgi:predicted lipid carrier protein YhbT